MNTGWPTETQRLLLHAALDRTAGAITAFEQWRQYVDLEGHIELGMLRLLPQVHANLRAQAFDDPLMGRLAGIHRYHWVEMRRLLHKAAGGIRLLTDAGIPVMLSKGIVVATEYHPSYALRPMSDVDLTIPCDRVDEAFSLLEHADWRQQVRYPSGVQLKHIVALKHGCGFINETGEQIDLHWRPVPEFGSARAIRRIWASAVQTRIEEIELLRCSTTHLLLLTLLHGIRPNPVAPIRWVSDALTILRSDAENVDWEELIAFAAEERVLMRIASAIEYLVREFGLSVQPSVLQRLRFHRSGVLERVESKLYDAPGGAGFWAGTLIRVFSDDRVHQLPSALAGAARILSHKKLRR